MQPIDRRGIRPRIVLLAAVALLVVAACGGSGADGGGEQSAASAAPAAMPAEAPAAEDQGGGVPQRTDTAYNAAVASSDDLKIVYTGSLDLVVDDLQASLAKARAAVLALGGYIGASQESNDGDRSTAVITYRIPAARWEDARTALRGLATEVVGEQTQATEVGGQLMDLEARIRNLRASEQALVDIAKGTGKVTDLLEVEARITDVRGQIEQLDGQRARLADQVAYGTLVTTFGREIAQVQEAKQGWDPTADVDGAVATMIGLGQGLVSGAIWFAIVWLPFLLALLVLALIGRWLFRRFVRTSPSAPPSGPVPGWGGESGEG